MVDGEVYHIEPQGALVTSRHLIYRESDSLLPAGKCGKLNQCIFVSVLCKLNDLHVHSTTKRSVH